MKLGNPRPETAIFHDRAIARAAGVKGGAATRQSAARFAELVRPLLEGDLAGLSANAAAQELNKRGVQTPRGGAWTARAVINVRSRLEE